MYKFLLIGSFGLGLVALAVVDPGHYLEDRMHLAASHEGCPTLDELMPGHGEVSVETADRLSRCSTGGLQNSRSVAAGFTN